MKRRYAIQYGKNGVIYCDFQTFDSRSSAEKVREIIQERINKKMADYAGWEDFEISPQIVQ